MVTHLPELLVLTIDVDPVLLHERKGIASTLVSQEARDVGVVARGITIFREGAITATNPEVRTRYAERRIREIRTCRAKDLRVIG